MYLLLPAGYLATGYFSVSTVAGSYYASTGKTQSGTRLTLGHASVNSKSGNTELRSSWIALIVPITEINYYGSTIVPQGISCSISLENAADSSISNELLAKIIQADDGLYYVMVERLPEESFKANLGLSHVLVRIADVTVYGGDITVL